MKGDAWIVGEAAGFLGGSAWVLASTSAPLSISKNLSHRKRPKMISGQLEALPSIALTYLPLPFPSDCRRTCPRFSLEGLPFILQLPSYPPAS